ncbi:hypothetical protein TYRP_003215 [Tyrophagus putrescentiae]|nr:hypothetical protein TYRP_003215 [Tyrophagus putrescentiae]
MKGVTENDQLGQLYAQRPVKMGKIWQSVSSKNILDSVTTLIANHVTTLITNVDYSNDFDCSNDFGCPNDFECSIYYCSNFLYFGLDHRRDGLHPNKITCLIEASTGAIPLS